MANFQSKKNATSQKPPHRGGKTALFCHFLFQLAGRCDVMTGALTAILDHEVELFSQDRELRNRTLGLDSMGEVIKTTLDYLPSNFFYLKNKLSH